MSLSYISYISSHGKRHTDLPRRRIVRHHPKVLLELQGITSPVPKSHLQGLSLSDIVELQQAPNEDSIKRKAHTNDILAYYGFPDGDIRGILLRGLDGDYHHGAEVVRAAFRLANSFGLHGNYENTSLGVQNIFASVARSIHMYGEEMTESFLRSFDLRQIPEIVELTNNIGRYSPLQIDGKPFLVHRSHLEIILRKADLSQLNSSIGPEIMSNLGYLIQKHRAFYLYIPFESKYTRLVH